MARVLPVRFSHCSSAPPRSGRAFRASRCRIVVPVAPGGNQDIVARAFAEQLTRGLGQQVIVESRPGASAIVGTRFVKSAPPDGYTLLGDIEDLRARAGAW